MRVAMICVVFAALLAATTAMSATMVVDWAGSGDFLTIGEGLTASAAGDTVLVRCGTYYEHDLDIGHDVYLCSETGSPDCVTVDAQGLSRVGRVHDVSSDCIIEGLTFTGGYQDVWYQAGGGLDFYLGSPVVRSCVFRSNYSEGDGGAVHASQGVVFEDCVFEDNSCRVYGGALICRSQEPRLVRCQFIDNSALGNGAVDVEGSANLQVESCTFIGNTGGDASVILCSGGASVSLISCTISDNGAGGQSPVVSAIDCPVTIERSIIAFNGGPSVGCLFDGTVSLACCGVFGNTGSDWPDCIADQQGTNNNASADPLFCGAENPEEPWTLSADSPYAPANSACGELVGAWGVGCGVTPVDVISWGRVKATYQTN